MTSTSRRVSSNSRPVGAGRRRFLALSAAMAVAPAWSAAPDSAASGTAGAAAATVVDRMPAFWRVYDETRRLPAADRMRALTERFFTPESALYKRAGWSLPDPEDFTRRLAKFDSMEGGVRSVHARFADVLRENTTKFRATLPDFDPAASPVFVLPSLFQFDGHLQPDGHSLPLFFAPDGIVRLHGADVDLGVLVAHENFHCYQGQRNPALALDPQPPLWVSLWVEGGAVWASDLLNPGASRKHVLLDDETLVREGAASAARVAAALLDEFDATDDGTQQAFFAMGARRAEWPDRAGYYVGYLAFQRLGREFSLRELAGMAGPRLRAKLNLALRDIRDARGA
jgi:hypothetical protein